MTQNPTDDASPAPASAGRGGLVLRYRKAILFLAAVLCLAGVYSALTMPASVFPQTDFPRVVILIDNGVMPADEMMATITRPVEEAMKDIPGTVNIRSATGRGAAEVNVFFTWSTDMVESELYVLGRLSQIRSSLPPEAEFAVHRLTFSAFPVIGVSLTSKTRSITDLWERARYDVYPRLLRIGGVARVNLVGGRVPEYHVLVDPVKLEAHRLSLPQVSQALADTNLFIPAGMSEAKYQLYLNVVDNRLRDPAEIEDVVVAFAGGSPVRVRDVATVRRGDAPQYNIVTADGTQAVLLNVYGQADSNTVAMADALHEELRQIRRDLPPDIHTAFFYDQSLFVREGVRSVWESIFIGLALSVLVLFLFLRSPAATLVTAAVIPVTVLLTLIGMRIFHMSFNLMTLGGIAAAIGLVIDDAIVVVEAIYAKVHSGLAPAEAARQAVREVGFPLIGSTLTPVVVFLPLALLTGVAGVFFRALALTMVFALLASLLLAVTWTPVTAAMLIRRRRGRPQDELEQGGPVLRQIIGVYEWVVRRALGHAWIATALMGVVIAGGVWLYGRLESDFLPKQDEGAFVLDYFTRPGTSLTETDRMLRHVEEILKETPEVESFSRRTGARLALAIAEPNTGDFLVKLRPARSRSTEEVIDELRGKVNEAEPALNTEFPGVLSDLIGDLTWSPNPVEIKIFSTDTAVLKQTAKEIAETIKTIPGVVDVNDGLVVAGPSRRFRVRTAEAARDGLTPRSIGTAIQTALLGDVSSQILQGDRILGVRVMLAPQAPLGQQEMTTLPLQAGTGPAVPLHDVARVGYEPGILEMNREDLRQLVAVSARFSGGTDLGTGIRTIQKKLAGAVKLPPGASLEYGGTYQQEQESFRNLTMVLATAMLLVYTVLLLEFRSLLEPLAIVMGAALALFGVVAALWITGTSLNIVSYLGAIIGVGIVAKNGILMLDYVEHLRGRGLSTFEALVQSGRRRLRPVLMTTLTALLGLLPLAYGVGAGADMLRPLAIGVIGALFMSLLLSLVATPVFYYVMLRLFRLERPPTAGGGFASGIAAIRRWLVRLLHIRPTTVGTLALLTASLALAAGCGRGGADAEEEGSKLPTTPVPVTATTVRRATLEPSIELVGTLVAIPEHTASVSAQTSRRIENVAVVEGAEVHARHTLLVELDSRMAKVDRDRAKASVDQKAAALGRLLRGSLPQEIEMARLEAEKARLSAETLREQLAALKVLFDKKELSAVQYENVRSSLRTAEATQAVAEARLRLVQQGSQPEEIAEAEAQLAAAEADWAAAQLTVDFCTVASPIDGTVTQLSARVGALADPAVSLATVADLSSLFARVAVPSGYQAQVRVGALVDVLLAGGPQRPVPGSIARISSEAASATGDVAAFALVENKDGALRPGFACTVRVRLAPVDNALVIPSAAVADREGKPVVTVVRDGKAHEIEVRLGVQTRHEVQVLEGLSEGDTVITEGGYGLPDGCPVEVRAGPSSEKPGAS